MRNKPPNDTTDTVVPWRGIPEMPKWQREMEKIFGSYAENALSVPNGKKEKSHAAVNDREALKKSRGG
jgi:hypothetical protein